MAVFGQCEGIEGIEVLLVNAPKEVEYLQKPKRKVNPNGFGDFFFPPAVRLLRLL